MLTPFVLLLVTFAFAAGSIPRSAPVHSRGARRAAESLVFHCHCGSCGRAVFVTYSSRSATFTGCASAALERLDFGSDYFKESLEGAEPIADVLLRRLATEPSKARLHSERGSSTDERPLCLV